MTVLPFRSSKQNECPPAWLSFTITVQDLSAQLSDEESSMGKRDSTSQVTANLARHGGKDNHIGGTHLLAARIVERKDGHQRNVITKPMLKVPIL
jgi:hypothetical protein